MAEKPQCPECHQSDNVRPIIYGKPTPELLEQWMRFEVELGGYVTVDGIQPSWTCTACRILIDGETTPNPSF